MKCWQEAKVEFVERNKSNLICEEEKEIRKLSLSEDDFWRSFKQLTLIPSINTQINKALQIEIISKISKSNHNTHIQIITHTFKSKPEN